jgi:hypothetical protein
VPLSSCHLALSWMDAASGHEARFWGCLFPSRMCFVTNDTSAIVSNRQALAKLIRIVIE